MFKYPMLVCKNRIIGFALAIPLLFISSSLCAQIQWDGGAGTTNWSDANNWDPDGLPTASDEVSIGSSGFVVIQNMENFTIKSLTLSNATLNINVSGQLNITVGGTYACTLDNGTFNNNGNLNISNCTNGIRLMGTTSSLDNHSTIAVDNHNGYGLLFSSGCTSCIVNNNGSFYFDNGLIATNPAIFYQVSGNHFNNLGLLDIGTTSNAGIGIGFGATASGSMNNSGTINIHNTGSGRAGISVGFLGGSLINNAGATINLGAGIGGTWAGGFNMALTNNGTINLHKAGTVSVVAMGTGTYGGTQPFDNSNNVSPASASIGCLQFNGDYTNTVGSPVPVTTIHLNGTTECTAHDKINIVGNANIGGTLTIGLASGFTPTAGQSFTVLQTGSRTGFYSTINYPTVSGIAWTTSYTTTAVIVNAQAVLPVELVDFTAIPMDERNVLLKWQTASEWDNAGFQVESSSDGGHWKSIGFVPGHGHSNEIKDYQFIDEPQKLIAPIYYRLRQLDIDGQSELSEVVTVSFSSNTYGSELAIWPNPTHDFFKIDGEFSPGAQLILYDYLGQVVMQCDATNGVQYEASSLKNGVYILTIHDQQRSTNYRLLKQG